MKINIAIPMAGLGKRFEKTHPNIPKPFININGKLMLSKVIENLKEDGVNFIFISQENILNDYRFQKTIS